MRWSAWFFGRIGPFALAGVALTAGCGRDRPAPPPAAPAYARILAGGEDPGENGPDDQTVLDDVSGRAGDVRFPHFRHASNGQAGYGVACRECHHATAPGASPEEGCTGCHRPPDVARDPAHAGPDDNLLLAGADGRSERVSPTPFNHFTHASSEGYRLPCASCHHTRDLVGCASCHDEVARQDAGGKVIPKAKRAFHQQCKGCHEAVRKSNPHTAAPTHCDACHTARPRERLEGALSLQRAYHLSCIGCHQRVLLANPAAKAPARACRDCHPSDVIVRVRQAEACHACQAHGTCASLGGASRDVFLAVENPLGARPGDRVALTLPEARVAQASLVLYLVPALGLLGGALLGAHLGGGAGANGAALAGSGLGLAVGLGITRLAGRRLGRRGACRPRMTAIVSRAPAGTPAAPTG